MLEYILKKFSGRSRNRRLLHVLDDYDLFLNMMDM
jgi:hypothetical protein